MLSPRSRAPLRPSSCSVTLSILPCAPVADGLGNPEIAQRLHISIATVKAHVGNLFAKLPLENRVQIALLVRDAEK